MLSKLPMVSGQCCKYTCISIYIDAVLRLCICILHAKSQLVWSDDNLFVAPASVVLQYSGVSGPLANVTMH